MTRTLGLVVVLVIGLTMAAWAGGQLPTRAAPQVQSPVLATDVTALRQQVTALEARVKALEGAIKVAGGAVTIKSTGPLSLSSAATVDIRGSVVKLNGGSKPLARVGDRVTVVLTTPGVAATGQIVEGSPTLLGP
jgi:hypothetical protein